MDQHTTDLTCAAAILALTSAYKVIKLKERKKRKVIEKAELEEENKKKRQETSVALNPLVSIPSQRLVSFPLNSHIPLLSFSSGSTPTYLPLFIIRQTPAETKPVISTENSIVEHPPTLSNSHLEPNLSSDTSLKECVPTSNDTLATDSQDGTTSKKFFPSDCTPTVDCSLPSKPPVLIPKISEEKPKLKKISRRKVWMKSLLQDRKPYDGENPIVDLVGESPDNPSWISLDDFNFLLEKIKPLITLKDTAMRKAIPAVERLAMTLRFLKTGEYYQELMHRFKISNSTISTTIPAVCKAIVDVLKDCDTLPSTEHQWQTIADGFKNELNFPNCIGSLTARHHVSCYCKKKESSRNILLIALVDADYRFVFAKCVFKLKLDDLVSEQIQIFEEIDSVISNCLPVKSLIDGDEPAPFVIVSDRAAKSGKRIIDRFRGKEVKGPERKVFNRHAMDVCRVADNAIGRMRDAFRVLQKPLNIDTDNACWVIMCCIRLHNFLKSSETSRSLYTPIEAFDHEENNRVVQGTWRRNCKNVKSLLPLERTTVESSAEMNETRDKFVKYFAQDER